jgi:hypothetical protein
MLDGKTEFSLTVGEINDMITTSVLYACGRSSYITSVVGDFMKTMADHASGETIDAVMKIIADQSSRSRNDYDMIYVWAPVMDLYGRLERRSVDPDDVIVFTYELDDFYLVLGSCHRAICYHDPKPVMSIDTFKNIIRRNPGTMNEKWKRNLLRDINDLLYIDKRSDAEFIKQQKTYDGAGEYLRNERGEIL